MPASGTSTTAVQRHLRSSTTSQSPRRTHNCGDINAVARNDRHSLRHATYAPAPHHGGDPKYMSNLAGTVIREPELQLPFRLPSRSGSLMASASMASISGESAAELRPPYHGQHRQQLRHGARGQSQPPYLERQRIGQRPAPLSGRITFVWKPTMTSTTSTLSRAPS